MTYRVARLTCATCNVVQRVRILLIGDIEIQPRCHDCGGIEWGADQSVESASIIEFSAFMEDFEARQAVYLRKQFDIWREERRAERQADEDGFDAARSAMFRELWHIVESPE